MNNAQNGDRFVNFYQIDLHIGQTGNDQFPSPHHAPKPPLQREFRKPVRRAQQPPPDFLGSEMDYVDDKFQTGFVFKNPNEKGRCGCGESFHV